MEDQYFSNEVSFKQKKTESCRAVILKPCLDMTPKLLPSQKKFQEDNWAQLLSSNPNSPKVEQKKSTFFLLKEPIIKLEYHKEENNMTKFQKNEGKNISQNLQSEKNMKIEFQEISHNNSISNSIDLESENENSNVEVLNKMIENDQKCFKKKRGYYFDDMDISNFDFFLLKSDEKMNIHSFSLAKIEDDLNKSKKNQQNVNIHDFQFIKIISKGAFGKVYLVKRKATEDYYAMKMVNFAEKVIL